MFKTAIGQDSHRFEETKTKPLVIGGIEFEGNGFEANSDGDVVLHAITNAISGLTGVNILGKIADDMCKSGITDSKEYLKKATEYLGNWAISHISISIEAAKPIFGSKIELVRKNIAKLLKLADKSVGITATTGEGLTDAGKGKGVVVFCVITAVR